MKDSVLFHELTPKDVRIWLKELHNGFHGGASDSFVDNIKKVPEVKAKWEVIKEPAYAVPAAEKAADYQRREADFINTKYKKEYGRALNNHTQCQAC